MTLDPQIEAILNRYRTQRVPAQTHVDAQVGSTYTPPAHESEVAAVIAAALPAVIAAVVKVFGDGKLNVANAVTLITAISVAVATVAPALPGADARHDDRPVHLGV